MVIQYNFLLKRADMARPSKKVGIIGGKGPDATVALFDKIIKYTPISCEEDHLRIIIDNFPATPKPSLAIVGKGESPIASMIESAKILQNAGADFIAIPCNSAHYFLNDVASKVEIPFLSIIEETTAYAKKRNLKKIGILATKGLLESRLYQNSLTAAGLTFCLNDENDQTKLMQGILKFKDSGKIKELSSNLELCLDKLMQMQADGVILGCTELPLVNISKNFDIELLDSIDILAKACVRKALE